MYDFEDVQTIEDCAEIALTDAYGEYEQIGCWQDYFNEVFSQTKHVRLLDEKVCLKGFDVISDVVLVAVCQKNKKQIKVTLDSIELIRPKKYQKLWLQAYFEWQV